MSVIIRDAAPGDEARWRELWAGYTTFYQVDVPEDVTASVWQRVFSPASPLFMRVAEVDGAVEGFAICLTHEGTWVKEPLLYLEDLFLDARLRGRGIGKALLAALIPRARACGKHVIVAGIEAGNQASIRLHEGLGFRQTALMPQVGMKFGRWLDLAFLQLVLDDRDAP